MVENKQMKEPTDNITGKSGPVRLARNDQGVAHITARELDDAHFGLGFCHARDRGLQMLLVRILGQGRACELLQDSEQMLELDRYFRRWNLGAAAADEQSKFSERARSAADAYCAGVNFYFANNRVPWELRLLGYHYEPWTISDSGMTGKLAGLVVLAQSQADMERFVVECVQHGISRERLRGRFPGQLKGLEEDLPRAARL